MTLNEKIQTAAVEAYSKGWKDAEDANNLQLMQARTAQALAAAKLMEEAGRIMSRAGYMIDKINNPRG